jgi:hypothetical protein
MSVFFRYSSDSKAAATSSGARSKSFDDSYTSFKNSENLSLFRVQIWSLPHFICTRPRTVLPQKHTVFHAANDFQPGTWQNYIVFSAISEHPSFPPCTCFIESGLPDAGGDKEERVENLITPLTM